MQVNPIRRIFRNGPPGAQLRLLALLVQENSGEAKAIMRELRKGLSETPEVARILRRQRPDGTWPVDAPTPDTKGAAGQLVLLGLLENLHALVHLGAHRNWPDVTRGLRALLERQRPDGRFALLYHHHASIGRLLMTLGQRNAPPVHRAAHWIAERQREDGGWLHPEMAGRRVRPPSCLWTTAEVLAFIARYPSYRIKQRLPRAAEYLLEHALEANSTTLLPDAGAWDVLAEGSQGQRLFQGGTLKVLDGLSLAGSNPSNTTFKKLYTWLLDQQLDNGHFPRVAGRDREGDAWVTVRALEVIHRVETTRPV
ncbi:MAG: hypothetical protein IH971_09050 [Candidatus Marinimicrobia bacterium]|nr:hypothetical protein [Candidatus Neomarinimicrobiota bacterium]